MSNAQIHRQTIIARFAASLAIVTTAAFAIPAGAATTWTTVAAETGSFSTSTATTVRYGANSSWVTKTVSGRGYCTNNWFGSDPIYGTVKSCQVGTTTATTTTANAAATTATSSAATTVTTATRTPTTAVATPVATTAAVSTPTVTAQATTSSAAAAAEDDTSGATTTATMSSTTADFNNPERGFYGWGADYLQNLAASALPYVRDTQGLSMTLALVNLSAYKGTTIPQSFIDTLTAKFAMNRSAGMKVVLRFVYNYDSSGSDASLALIKQHTAQLATLIAANADVIGQLQAGFIGAWGEWHDSASGNTSDANKAAIRDAVLAMAPATLPVQFRYPYDMIKWYPTALTAAQAFNGSAQSRVGIHNDCFMSDNTDVGTYQSASLTGNTQRDYAKAVTEYVPFGGETCGGFSPARMTCAAILAEGPAYHLAYLNFNYYAAFFDSWKSGGCYDQVKRSIGYRFQLDAVTHPTSAARNSSIAINVDLHNVGWARIFSPRKLVVTLRNKSTGALITATGTTDMRMLPSQASASTRANVSVAIPSGAATGTYDVLIAMPDVYTTTAGDPRFSVRFANADTVAKGQAWDTTAGRFAVGTTVTIQ